MGQWNKAKLATGSYNFMAFCTVKTMAYECREPTRDPYALANTNKNSGL
jgi:hypothetical protein